MKSQLLNALNRGQVVDIMYIAKNREITKRRVKLIKIDANVFHAFCFTRNAKRTFVIDNILAMFPVMGKRGVS